jgi:hypothetical protein
MTGSVEVAMTANGPNLRLVVPIFVATQEIGGIVALPLFVDRPGPVSRHASKGAQGHARVRPEPTGGTRSAIG